MRPFIPLIETLISRLIHKNIAESTLFLRRSNYYLAFMKINVGIYEEMEKNAGECRRLNSSSSPFSLWWQRELKQVGLHSDARRKLKHPIQRKPIEGHNFMPH